jgi:glycosyltransferase involved in cell wall biosynthesis
VIIYLTYNDQPTGVYWSQVTDVVRHLNGLGTDRVRLVALISLRGFRENRNAIRARSFDAIVLPMVPMARNWRLNLLWLRILCQMLKPTAFIARGVFATDLALKLREKGRVAKVCFDARAAYGVEWEEFRLVEDERLIREVPALEDRVVKLSDVRMSVSHVLVQHWRHRFGYKGERHVVIPCTMGSGPSREERPAAGGFRSRSGWGAEDTVLVYSGSSVGWQSIELMVSYLRPWLATDLRRRMLFLCDPHLSIDELLREFPAQVARHWLPYDEVRSVLEECDHGLLVRYPCVTNRVASPTKFAEYLSAGLPVIISRDVGDFSALVEGQDLGNVVSAGIPDGLVRTPPRERDRLRAYAQQHLTKEANAASYMAMLAQLGTGHVEWNRTDDPVTGPLVSIIVPSYNKGRFIGDMVRSVQEQSDHRWELLVVDDGSTDGSVELLQSLAASDERIRVLPMKVNRGANHCRNVGIAEARGRYVIFLDADDLLAPHCLAERLAIMNGSGLDMAVFTMEVFRNAIGDHGQRWVPESPTPLHDFLRHALPWQTMQPIWDRVFLRSLGGFDEDFSRHQDVELHTRALLHPTIVWRAFPGEPDCHYRIAEERKVGDAFGSLQRYCDSALRFHRKFHKDARGLGRPHLIRGIIQRTYLHVLLHARDKRINSHQLRELENLLLPTEVTEHMSAGARYMLSITRWYNLRGYRVPGVNRILFELLTM